MQETLPDFADARTNASGSRKRPQTLEDLATRDYADLAGVLGSSADTANFYFQKWRGLLSRPEILRLALAEMRHDPPSTYTFYDGPTGNAAVVVDREAEELYVFVDDRMARTRLELPNLEEASE